MTGFFARKENQTPRKKTIRQPTQYTTWLQTNLYGNKVSTKFGQAFGDSRLPVPTQGTTRVLDQNIHILPVESYDEKSRHYVKQIQGGDSGHVRLHQEIGINWSNIKQHQKWKERKGRARTHAELGFNKKDSSKKPVQPGGTAVIVSGGTVGKIKESGSDNMGGMDIGRRRTTDNLYFSI